MGKNMKRIFQFIISTIIILSALIGRDYYIYCTAESEDEVALIRFDGKVAHVEKRIPVGVWPVEIEGPHGITVSPDGNYWYCHSICNQPRNLWVFSCQYCFLG